jgi:hypothetical protein
LEIRCEIPSEAVGVEDDAAFHSLLKNCKGIEDARLALVEKSRTRVQMLVALNERGTATILEVTNLMTYRSARSPESTRVFG